MTIITDICDMIYDYDMQEVHRLACLIIPVIENRQTWSLISGEPIKPVSVPKYKFTPMNMCIIAFDLVSRGEYYG